MKSGKYTEKDGGTYEYSINKNGYLTHNWMIDGDDGIHVSYNKKGFPKKIDDDSALISTYQYDSHNCMTSCSIIARNPETDKFEPYQSYTVSYTVLK